GPCVPQGETPDDRDPENARGGFGHGAPHVSLPSHPARPDREPGRGRSGDRLPGRAADAPRRPLAVRPHRRHDDLLTASVPDGNWDGSPDHADIYGLASGETAALHAL